MRVTVVSINLRKDVPEPVIDSIVFGDDVPHLLEAINNTKELEWI